MLLRLAGGLLTLTAFIAPWVGGAQTTLPDVRWWLAAAMTIAFLLVVAGRLWAGRGLSIGPVVIVPVVFLLGCLGWWATQDELRFATAFGAEHWAFLQDRYPLAIFQWPRLERLGFWAALLLGFVAALELGRRESFRRQLSRSLAASALLVAIYALGMAWLGWGSLPWTMIGGDTEQFNVCFSHYSGPPACLNLAWPLVLYGVAAWRGRSGWIPRIVMAVCVAAALPLWNSAAGKSIAIGLLVTGAVWWWAAKKEWLTPRLICAALAGIFLVIFAGEWFTIARTQSETPDGWVSASDTLLNSTQRDAQLREAVALRGDHLVASPAADRPSAWLAGLRMAADHPWLGLGPGAWVKQSALYTHDTVVRTFYHYRQYTHHDLIQLAAEWGGLATVAMLVLWIGGIWNAVHRDSLPLSRNAGLVLALVGVALHSTVDFPLQIPALQLWTALLLGLAWSSTRNPSGKRPSTRTPGRRPSQV